MREYSGIHDGVLDWSRSAAVPLMYRKRNGRPTPASCSASKAASVEVWHTRVTSSKERRLDFDGVIATVLPEVAFC
jgi:hypothetical protein